MTRNIAGVLSLCLLAMVRSGLVSAADLHGAVQWRAHHYERDLRAHTVKGKGGTWLKYNDKEVWADEMEWNSATNEASARGNVHVKQGPVEMWCDEARFQIDGEGASLTNATVVVGQLVMTGAVIRRIDKKRFEIEEGNYTNCNVELVRDRNVGGCQFDWKLYGRHFSITLEEYAHVSDAIVYVKQLPILYTPYFIVPIKTQRQSGFLMPSFAYTQTQGNGLSLPYYQVLGPWHDLTFTPTYYTKTGYHLGLNYRYIHSGRRLGSIDLFGTQRRFSANPDNPAPDDPTRERTLGLFGEWAINGQNVFSLWGRAQSRQVVRLVSHPYFSYDYAMDLGPQANLSWLRSQASATLPTDDFLFAARVTHHQSLTISEDFGVDRGGVTQLPTITISRATTPLLGQILSYEVDATLTNFYRPWEFDTVPDFPVILGANSTGPSLFSGNDYLRVGRRLQLEPRLVANVPMPTGLQLQPSVTAGTLLYHFDLPSSQLLHQEYVTEQIPFSLYLHRNFETGIEGYEHVSHVLQPRVIYAASSYQSEPIQHPFFYNRLAVINTGPIPTQGQLSSPRFDINDQLTPFEYFRFELINRFRRKTPSSIQRFLLLQVSEQFNLRTTPTDIRYARRLGPIELLTQVNIWRFIAQAQALYQLETTGYRGTQFHENEWSTSIAYQGPNRDAIGINTRFYTPADPTLTEKSLYLSWYKSLPLFFDIEGNLEYSMLGLGLLGYRIGFVFAAKPRSCWGLEFVTGQNSNRLPFAYVNFRLDFGGTGSVKPL